MNRKKMLKILHIDDNNAFLDVFSKLFRKQFDIVSTDDGNLAPEIIEQEKIDIVLTDYEMPQLDGLGVLRLVKLHRPDVPVIFYTGQGNESVAREAFMSGASDYFTKAHFGIAHKEKLINSIKRAVEIRDKEKEKKESEEKYSSLVELSPDPVVIIKDMDFLFINSAFTKLFGFGRKDINKGLKFDNLVPKESRSIVIDILDNSEESKSSSGTFSVILLNSKGETVESEISYTNITVEKETARLLIIRDKTLERETQRKLLIYQNGLSILGAENLIKAEDTEEDLTDSNLVEGKYAIEDLIDFEYLHRILDYFSQATGFTTGFVSYPDQKVLIATGWHDICTKFHRAYPESAAFCKKSNIKLTQWLKRNREMNLSYCENGLVDGATPIIVRGKFIAYLATGQIFFEKPDRKKFEEQAEKFGYDKEAYLEAMEKAPIVSEEQFRKVLIFLAEMATMIAEQGLAHLKAREYAENLAAEIAERKKVEKDLKKSEVHFRSLVELSTDMIWEVDKEGRFTYCSPTSKKILGYEPDEMIGKNPFDFVPPGERSEMLKIFHEFIDSEKPFEHLKHTMIRKDGSVVTIETNGMPLFDDKGKLKGYRGIDRKMS